MTHNLTPTVAVLVISFATTLMPAAANAEQTLEPPVVLHNPISTLDAQEGLIADVRIPANGSLPLHQHPGDEFLYMLQGTVELAQQDQGIRLLKAGDAYQIPAGTIHSPKAGPDGARAIVFRVHPSGMDVTVPVTVDDNE